MFHNREKLCVKLQLDSLEGENVKKKKNHLSMKKLAVLSENTNPVSNA